MRTSIEKLALSAAILATSPSCNTAKSEVGSLQTQQHGAVVEALTPKTKAEAPKYYGVQSSFKALKTAAAQRHAAQKTELDAPLYMQTQTGTKVTVKVSEGGSYLGVIACGDFFPIDLASSVPFQGECMIVNSAELCRTGGDDAAVIERGLTQAFKNSASTNDVFKAFGVVPEDSAEEKATIIMDAIAEKM